MSHKGMQVHIHCTSVTYARNVFYQHSVPVLKKYFLMRKKVLEKNKHANSIIRGPYFRSLLPPANEVCRGNVFTGVCLSTGGGCVSSMQWPRGVCIPACTGQGGVCPRGCGRHPRRILWDTVNKRAVRILLECILVWFVK